MSSHNLTEAILQSGTLVSSSEDSYIYKCPMCDKENRYAEPIGLVSIFCNGDDFGTKIRIGSDTIEESYFYYFKEAYATDEVVILNSNNNAALTDALSIGLVSSEDNLSFTISSYGRGFI